MIANQVAGLLAPPYTAPVFSSDFDSIQTYTVGSGGQATISFTSIPQTYKHLQIRWIAKDNYSGGGTDVNMRFNSDSGSNYSWHQLLGDGSSPAQAYAVSSQTSMRAGATSGVADGSNIFAATVLDILDYTSTNKNKTVRNLAGFDKNGGGSIALNSGLWFNSSIAAITQIDLTPRVGTLFSQYSTFALYGVK